MYGKCECFVMQMLYVCVVYASCGYGCMYFLAALVVVDVIVMSSA